VNKNLSVAAYCNSSVNVLLQDTFDICRKTFSSGDEMQRMTLSDKIDLFFHDYGLVPLFAFENYIGAIPYSSRSLSLVLYSIFVFEIALSTFYASVPTKHWKHCVSCRCDIFPIFCLLRVLKCSDVETQFAPCCRLLACGHTASTVRCCEIAEVIFACNKHGQGRRLHRLNVFLLSSFVHGCYCLCNQHLC